MSDDIVARARSMIGCRFRAQGRRPETGLDCVGLVCAVFDLPADEVPRDYRLRGASAERLNLHLGRFFQAVRTDCSVPGDVLVLRAGEDQLHLAILTELGFIHSDAGLRTVVETPGRPAWPVLSAHRSKDF